MRVILPVMQRVGVAVCRFTDGELRLSEVLSALSHALDMTEGQPRGQS